MYSRHWGGRDSGIPGAQYSVNLTYSYLTSSSPVRGSVSKTKWAVPKDNTCCYPLASKHTHYLKNRDNEKNHDSCGGLCFLKFTLHVSLAPDL